MKIYPLILCFLACSSVSNSVSAADKPLTSCEQFVKLWQKNYPPAKKYSNFQCSRNTPVSEWDSTLIIHGNPTADTEDFWYYSPKMHEVMHQINGKNEPPLNATTFKSSVSANIEVAITKENCAKLNATSTNYKDAMAENIGVPKQTLVLQGGAWRGLSGCRVFYQTPKGPYSCIFSSFLSDDGGTTTFAAGYGRCEKENP